MPDKTEKKESTYSQLKGFKRAVPIILLGLAVFVAICFITQNTGAVGRAISGFFLGTFSVGGYFIPVLIAIHALFFPSDVHKKKVLISRIIFSLVLVITVSVLAHAITNYGEELTYSASELYNNGKQAIGGGFIGGTFAFAIIKMIDYIGLIILTLTVFALYIAYFLAGENNAVRSALGKLLYKIVDLCARIEARLKGKKADKKADKERKDENGKRLKESKRRDALMAKEEKLYDDDFFAVDNGLKELRIDELGINEHRRDEDIEKNPTLHEKVHPRAAAKEDAVFSEPIINTEADFKDKEPEKKKFNADYGINSDGDIIIEAPDSSAKSDRYPSYDYSDRADSVFTKDFNPYSLEENERLANKPSSRAAFDKKADEGVTEIRGAENPKKVFSERELEEARRRARFELRREELIKEEAERRAAAERAVEEKKAADEMRAAEERRLAEEARAAAELREAEERRIKEEEQVKAEALRAAEFTAAEPRFSDASEPIYTAPEEIKDDVPFRTFSSPEPQIYKPEAVSDVEDTIKITRSVMPDTVFTEDEEDKSDDTLCVFTDNAVGTDEEDDDEDTSVSAVFEFDDEDDLPDGDEIEIPPEKQNPDVLNFRKLYDIFDDKKDDTPDADSDNGPTPFIPDGAPTPDDADDDFEDEEDIIEQKDVTDDDEDDVPFDDYMPIHAPAPPEPKKPPQEKPASEKPDYSSFKFPPIDLLAKGKDTEDPSIELEIQENGEKLIDALAQFNVRASVRSVDRGPRITRYEIVPARGVRVNSVISLFDDIALNLAAEGIRMEAPIPGKSAIGVEIPNKHPSTVMLRDLLETEEFKNESSKTFSCVGKDVTGNPVFGDMSKMPHILIAGATGMGKSVCINSILISILYKARPDEVKFIMIDPKTVEFTMYNGIPHLLVPVVTDVKQAAGALMWAIDEMNRRYELMAKHEVRKLDSYNDIVRENPELGEPLPKIIIVIDELNDLMQQVRKPVEGLITNITQKARAAGIHMIIGTQRPSVDVITGVIKANVPSRISCKVTSFNDSKTILDQAGAEKLLDKGDMLYAPVGKPKPVRVQGAFVSDGEVEKIMKFLKSNVKGAIYDEQAMEGINRAAQKCAKGSKDSGFDDDFDTDSEADGGGGYLSDKQFLEAADLATKQGKISTSLLQRKIGIGYGKAAKFIDMMEELGIVSEANGQKPRDVLVTRDEWREMLSRRSLDD